jgi:hypothetical protein
VTQKLTLTEKDWQRQVVDLAKTFRWTHYHPYLSIRSPRGWPDLALCRPPRLVLAELKSEKGKTSPAQDHWIELLRACDGVEVYVWRPADFDDVAEVLR